MVYTNVNLTQVPVRVRTLREFEAADPWNPGRITPWRLGLYKLVPEQTATAADWAQIKPSRPVAVDPDPLPGGRILRANEAIGIETPNGRSRMLPRALQTLWSQGAVADVHLPGALALLEPRLSRRDFFGSTSGKIRRWVIIGILAVVSASVLGLYVIADAHPERISHNVERDAWLARPAREETVNLQHEGLNVHKLGVLPPQSVHASAALTVQPGARTLGWYQAAGARRLVVYDDTAQMTPQTWAEGPVVRTERVGLTPATLEAAGAAGPAYDRRYLLIHLGGWTNPDPTGIGDEGGGFFLELAGVPIVVLGIVLAVLEARRARQRRLSEEVSRYVSEFRGSPSQ